jgi:hypothetical protein
MSTYVAYNTKAEVPALLLKQDPSPGFFARLAEGWRVFNIVVDPVDGRVVTSEVFAEAVAQPVMVTRMAVKVGGETVAEFDAIPKVEEKPVDRKHLSVVEVAPAPDASGLEPQDGPEPPIELEDQPA